MRYITRRRGDTYADVFKVQNKLTKQIVDLAGCMAVMTLDPNKAPVDASTNVYSLIGAVDVNQGTLAFAPSPEEADRLGSFYYDVQLVFANGRKRTVEVGRYRYVQDITKV